MKAMLREGENIHHSRCTMSQNAKKHAILLLQMQGGVLASKKFRKNGQKVKKSSVNQLECDEIKSQSIKSKNQRQYGEGKEVGKGPKQDLGKETKIRALPKWNHPFLLQVNPPVDKQIPSWSLDP
jgi:hypothetical protein